MNQLVSSYAQLLFKTGGVPIHNFGVFKPCKFAIGY